jgi:hypothetical protein
MKKYLIKVDKKLLNKFKPYWKDFQGIEADFYKKIGNLERKMSKELKIDNLEIFVSDSEYVGIGNYERTMRLIHRFELEKD